jgi:hypothetical protein
MNTPRNIQPAWFDSHGYLLGTLPEDCVSDCSHAGACEADVRYWRGRLDFSVPRERAIGYLREFGAWTAEELADRTDEELAEIVLWVACGDLRESGEWLGLVHGGQAHEANH